MKTLLKHYKFLLHNFLVLDCCLAAKPRTEFQFPCRQKNLRSSTRSNWSTWRIPTSIGVNFAARTRTMCNNCSINTVRMCSVSPRTSPDEVTASRSLPSGHGKKRGRVSSICAFDWGGFHLRCQRSSPVKTPPHFRGSTVTSTHHLGLAVLRSRWKSV